MTKKKPVDLENDRPVFEGLSQYCPPHCFELAGRELKLVMDNGYDYLLRFGRETVEWGVVGETPRKDEYVALKADDTKSLAKWLSHEPQCKLLLEFEKLDARGELYKTLNKVGKVEKYDVPKQYKMADWIAAAIPTHFNKAIDRDACNYLAEALGNDTKLVSEEIEKVLLFAPDCKKITLDIVREMIVPQREMVAYEINDSFGLRDAKTYTRMLNEMLNNGVNAIQIVGSLYRYAVDLMNFSTLLDKGMQAKDAAAALGKNDFIFNVKGKAPECAKRWGRPLLIRVIRRLADLDYEIKSGMCSTRIAQELALASLVVR